MMRGPCSVSDGCLLSPNYPHNYSNKQRCVIMVNSTLARPIQVIDWDVEFMPLGIGGVFVGGDVLSWQSD